MQDRDTAAVAPPTAIDTSGPVLPKAISGRLLLAWTIVAGIFAAPLYHLGRFAQASDLYSYILLIPCVSGYLVWTQRRHLPVGGPAARTLGTSLLIAGAVAFAIHVSAGFGATPFAPEDTLAIGALGFVAAMAGTTALFSSQATFRTLLFPLGFLLFIVPLPTAVLQAIEIFMQHGSAAVAHALFDFAGTPVFYQDLLFQLPGITLHVAPECSGIRSTLVLLIVSVLAGYFFLRSPIRRTVLALAIVPLALVRNGFRIFVIGELCVRVGPEMIDSLIHRRGGPIFFALSLVPLFALLVLLQRRERRTRTAGSPS